MQPQQLGWDASSQEAFSSLKGTQQPENDNVPLSAQWLSHLPGPHHTSAHKTYVSTPKSSVRGLCWLGRDRRKQYLHPVEQHQQEGADDDRLEDLPVPAEGSQPRHEELPRHFDEARHHGDHEPVPRRTELYPWNTEHMQRRQDPTNKGVHRSTSPWPGA